MDLNGLPQTVQNFINDTIRYRESGNCLDYDTCQKILEYAADTGSQKLTGLGLYYLAECYWQKGEYENTMQCLTEGLSLALHEDEASMLLTYFKIITGILSEHSPVVTQLIRKSILY